MFGVIKLLLLAAFVSGCASSVEPRGLSASFEPVRAAPESCSVGELQAENERLKADGLSLFDENKQLRKLAGQVSASASLVRNPSKKNGHDYALCGRKYAGSRTGCDGIVECTGSMMPLFNCEEKLFFVKPKILAVGDVIDVKLSKPKYYEGGVVVTHVIHYIKSFEGNSIVTARLNPGTSGFYTGQSLIDDETSQPSDVLGVLRGIEW